MQARRIARELALLSVGQLSAKQAGLETHQLESVVVAAVRTLTSEAQDALESAAAELQQSNTRLLNSQIRATDVESARTMVSEAIDLTQTAINRLGVAMEVPEFIQLSNQKEVRAYTLELIGTLKQNQAELDRVISAALVDWQLSRLAAIDRDILRIAVTEIMFLGVPDRVAINESVELAKRYSGDDGHRFINGVLRRVVEHLAIEKLAQRSVTQER
ncbi:MAG TPA: transcription antitermination factor NusB [Thermosynechococcaceae cyanobacterium]